MVQVLTSSNVLVGVELEYSDVNCKTAQQQLENLFSYPFDAWRKSHGTHKKIVLDYSRWNCVTDNTIINSDGTRCSMSYIVDGEMRYIFSPNEHIEHSKGIEVISPPIADYEILLSDVEKINEAMFTNGATVGRHLDTALHFHIDANDLTFEQIKNIPIKMLPIQEALTKFFAYDGIPTPLYRAEEAEAFAACNSMDELTEIYASNGAEYGYSIEHYFNRRVVDIGPWIKKEHPLKTIEFRGFSMSTNIDCIAGCLHLCLDIFDYLINNKPLINFNERVEAIVAQI